MEKTAQWLRQPFVLESVIPNESGESAVVPCCCPWRIAE